MKMKINPEEFRRDFECFARSVKYFEDNCKTIKATAKYLHKFIAIYDGKIVAYSKSFTKLLKVLDKNGIPRGTTFLQYITDKQIKFILNNAPVAELEQRAASTR